MGPPRERDGEVWTGQKHNAHLALQWGRRVNATESEELGVTDILPKQLQWGRRVNATESPGQHYGFVRSAPGASMPPRERDGETNSVPLQVIPSRDSFNGAAA